VYTFQNIKHYQRQNSRIALRAKKKTQRNCENRAKEIIPGTQPSRKASLRVDKGNSITLRPAATNDIYFSQYEGNNDIIFRSINEKLLHVP
jgi:hypothetical protein